MRSPLHVKTYRMSPSLPTDVPSAPVSSATSRTAVASADSPRSIRPFGNAQRPSGLPAGRIAAKTQSPRRRRTRTPPAENSRFTPAFVTEARMPSDVLARSSPEAINCPGTPATRVPDPVTKSLHRRRGWMNLQPLGDRLIVEALEDEETTSSGIVLPDTAKEKPQRGRVLAVGPGARNDKGEVVPLEVAEGDEVIYSKYGGTEIKLGADEVLILRESDVLAKVTTKGAKSSKKK